MTQKRKTKADFLDCSFGFRPGKSAYQAIGEIRQLLAAGFREAYDADLKGYFDSIRYDKLMAAVSHRIADGRVLGLIRRWLRTPVVETDKHGKRQIHQPKVGTPQGGVISPLLANLYLHWFDKRFHFEDGPAHFANAKLIRYADDFLVLARFQGNRLVDCVESFIETRMGLEINREKTQIVDLDQPSSSLDFLGYRFRYDRDLYGRSHRYLNLFPKPERVSRITQLKVQGPARQSLIDLPDQLGDRLETVANQQRMRAKLTELTCRRRTCEFPASGGPGYTRQGRAQEVARRRHGAS